MSPRGPRAARRWNWKSANTSHTQHSTLPRGSPVCREKPPRGKSGECVPHARRFRLETSPGGLRAPGELCFCCAVESCCAAEKRWPSVGHFGGVRRPAPDKALLTLRVGVADSQNPSHPARSCCSSVERISPIVHDCEATWIVLFSSSHCWTLRSADMTVLWFRPPKCWPISL